MIAYFFRVFSKLIFLTLVPMSVALAIAVVFRDTISSSERSVSKSNQDVLIVVPMKNTNWKDLGVVSEPLLQLDVRTIQGYKKHTFLLDSGAVISSLPREWAELTGQNLAFLPRSTFGGFGGKTSVAYVGEMLVLLGGEEVLLPVVFTEAAGTKSLLGRKGFFTTYTISFYHTTNQLEIRR